MSAPALNLDLSGIAVSQPRVPGPIASAFATVQTTMNSLGNIHIASDAAIATSKLELAAGSPTAIGMNNNVAYKAKNAAGTLKDLVKLGTDDLLRLSQINEKFGSTTTTRENQVIARGSDFVTGAGASSATKSVTMPVTFTDAGSYDVFVTIIGTKTGSDPSGRSDTNSNYTASTIRVQNSLAADSFTVEISLFTGNIASGHRILFSWLAIGTKA
jgi:hypothetical protein